MRSSGLVRLFILCAAVVLLVSVPAVEAATVSMTVEEGVDVALTYQAAPGEINEVSVSITADFDGWIVNETGFCLGFAHPLTAGPGCTSLTAQIALCEHNLEEVDGQPLHVVLLLGDSPVIPFVDTAHRAWASLACGPSGDPFGCYVRIREGRVSTS